MKHRIALGAAVTAACGMIISQLAAQQREAQQPAGPYTAEQASAGRAAYQANCASCHAPDLSGREGPQLAGANFISQWGDKTVGDLIGFMRATMPPGAGGSLPDQTYINLAAFILDANSARPRKWCSRMSTIPSIRAPGSLTIATISSSSAWESGCQRVHRRRAARTGPR